MRRTTFSLLRQGGRLRTNSILNTGSAAPEPRRLMTTKIYFGCDGFGEELKDSVVSHLGRKDGVSIVDLGCTSYYAAAAKVAKAVQREGDRSVRGMLFCGTGMGVGITANKFSGVRAATVENEFAARASRSINDSNVLCLGGKITSAAEAATITDAWLEQAHQQPPILTNSSEAPEWWSPEVEQFLANKWDELDEVERSSRSS